MKQIQLTKTIYLAHGVSPPDYWHTTSPHKRVVFVANSGTFFPKWYSSMMPLESQCDTLKFFPPECFLAVRAGWTRCDGSEKAGLEAAVAILIPDGVRTAFLRCMYVCCLWLYLKDGWCIGSSVIHTPALRSLGGRSQGKVHTVFGLPFSLDSGAVEPMERGP